jgi:hypothetical protein
MAIPHTFIHVTQNTVSQCINAFTNCIEASVTFYITVTIPAIAVSLRAYLIEHPLPSSRTRTIKTQATLSPSCVPSASLGIVNPKHHQTWTDSFSIKLSRREIGAASDEELLARFTKGFFGGWTFAAENNILMLLHAFGRQLVPVGFSGKSDGVDIDIPTMASNPPHQASKLKAL